MHIHTIGIISPGEMGCAIGMVLQQHGMRIVTNVQGRSIHTANRVKDAGFGIVPDDETLVREADLLLSILPPDQAYGLAERIATALHKTGADLLYVDCNAIAPRTVQAIDRLLSAAGASFVDGGIIGPPPSPGRPGPRLYVSGTHAEELAQLQAYGLDLRLLSSLSGQASGLKMCYATITKGLTALATEALVAGRALGVEEALAGEVQALPFSDTIEHSVPSMPPKASRWVGEMEEIAQTFSDLELPPQMPEGAASLYRFIAGTILGTERPEQRHRGQTLEDVISILATAHTKQIEKDQREVGE